MDDNLIKKFENFTVVNFLELDNNWDSDFQVNRKDGKKPFIKKEYSIKPVPKGKSIPRNVLYMTDEKAEELNIIGDKIRKLIEEYGNTLKKN